MYGDQVRLIPINGDLDHITDDIDIVELFNDFKQKSETFNQPEHKCLFDLDDEVSPLENLDLLLA